MAERAGRRITGRALLLGAVLVLLAVVLAGPTHRYLAARNAAAQAQAQQASNEAKLAELNKQLSQWNDPAYVEQQARERLQYALPGETVYVIVTPGESSPAMGSTPSDTGPERLPGQTWNQRLWGSLQAADSAP
ncbi:MAG: septum formation initiator family protein [Actinomycetia bacterium]|nr:septum formation initiator family protein [Actinomycetes bacterium]